MRIWDPVGDYLEGILFPEEDRRFICTVNGERTFRGETLPVGTCDEIKSWICERFRLEGELVVVAQQASLICFQQSTDRWWWRTWGRTPEPIRLLVSVDGVEHLFRLTPVADLRLTWNGNANQIIYQRQLQNPLQMGRRGRLPYVGAASRRTKLEVLKLPHQKEE